MSKNRDRILLSAVVTLFWYAQYVYIPCQTPFLTAQSVSSSMIGIIIGAYGVSQMLARLPVGVMADTVNKHKYFIMLGAASSGMASIIRIISSAGGGFLVANLFSGFASAMWISFMVLYSSYYDAEHQQIGSSRIVMYNNVGMLLAFVVSTLFYDVFGMRFLCLTSCIAGGIGVVLAMLLEKPQARAKAENDRKSVIDLLKICKRKRLIAFALLMLVQQGVQMSTVMSFTTQVIKDLGGTATFIGIASVIYMLSSVVMSFVASSRICTVPGGRLWVPLVFVMVAAYCVLVPHTESLGLFLVLQIIPGVSSGILVSFLISESMVGVPVAKKSTAMGFFQAVYAMGMTGLPIVMGRVVDFIGMGAGFYVLAAVAIAAALSSIIVYKKVC